MDAEAKILSGNQEVSVHGTAYKRADLATIANRITYWSNEVERLEAAAGETTTANKTGPIFRNTKIVERPYRG